jgi:hypothetical protein
LADLSQAFRRLDWAGEHLDRLQLEMSEYLESGVVGIDTAVDEDGNEQFTARVEAQPPIELALRAADVVHHFRAALDNAVWALHPHGTKRTQFPVASTQEGWANVQAQIQGLSDEVINVLLAAQPFVDGGLGANLVQLNELAAWDRHRTPQILVGSALSAGFGGFGLPADVPTPLIRLGLIENGYVVGYFAKAGYWAEYPLPEVSFDIFLQFGPETPAAGRPVLVALAGFQQTALDALQRLNALAA